MLQTKMSMVHLLIPDTQSPIVYCLGLKSLSRVYVSRHVYAAETTNKAEVHQLGFRESAASVTVGLGHGSGWVFRDLTHLRFGERLRATLSNRYGAQGAPKF
jgi:hypothetical protein